MKKVLFALIVLLGATRVFGAAPPINFTTLGPTGTFNGAQNDSASAGGVTIDGYVFSAGPTFDTGQGFLWLRNDTNDHGLGYCSEGSACGPTNTTGNGDWNELSNNNKNEIIRLTRPDGFFWSGVWVSSLDTGGTNSNETGTIYWSNSAAPNLVSLTDRTTFSHATLGSTDEGSIWAHLSLNGIDPNAKYLFFKAGTPFGVSPNNGTNNDYLVWGVSVTPIPEPEIYAMLLVGLGLLGFVARRRRQQAAAA